MTGVRYQLKFFLESFFFFSIPRVLILLRQGDILNKILTYSFDFFFFLFECLMLFVTLYLIFAFLRVWIVEIDIQAF